MSDEFEEAFNKALDLERIEKDIDDTQSHLKSLSPSDSDFLAKRKWAQEDLERFVEVRKSLVNWFQEGTWRDLSSLTDDERQRMLQAAASGNSLLYVGLRPYTATLKPNGRTIENPKHADRTCSAGERVPLHPAAANRLSMHGDAVISCFQPEESWEESHPWHEHIFVLGEPQKVTIADIWYRQSQMPSDAKAEEKSLSEAQERQVALIDAVRRRMTEQKDRGDKVNRMQAIRELKDSGELRRLGFHGGNVLDRCRKLTDPNQVETLGLSALPK